MTEISWPADSTPSRRWPIYTRGNIGEVYPDVVLPLEWDVAGLPSERGWRRAAEHIGFAVSSDFTTADGPPEEMIIVGVFGGYAYFNASLMRLLGVRTPGLSVDVIDTQFLGAADVPAYEPQEGDRNLAATARMVRSAVKTLTARKVPLVQEMHRRATAHRDAAPPSDAADEALWTYIADETPEEWEFLIASHVINTMQATIASGGLTDLCEAKLGDPNLAVTLTAGIGEVVSADPARRMWELANETKPEDFPEAFRDFLSRYGHRGPNEFSMAGRDWAAFPEVAEAAIDSMRDIDAERSPAEQARRVADERDAALDAAHKKIGWQSKRLDMAIKSTALWSRAREDSKDAVIRYVQASRHAYLELARRARERGGPDDLLDPMLLKREEFVVYLDDPQSMMSVIDERRSAYKTLRGLEPPFAFDAASNDGLPPPTSTWRSRRIASDEALATGTVLTGAAGAPGVARGRARVVHDPADPSALEQGDILVAALTDPSWTPLFVSAGAVVVEVGAAMSHSMIVSRELGIPCVVGVEDATLRIPDGTEIEVDGQAGTVTVI